MTSLMNMHWYYYLTGVSLIFCLAATGYHLIRIIRLGMPEDFSAPAGKIAPAILYSYTGAMNPAKKESARLHLPTYTAGILYHLGTFLSIFLFYFFLFQFNVSVFPPYLICGFLMVTAGCGNAVLVKRFIKRELHDLSGPDDYISNLLVTLFQVATALVMIIPSVLPVYFITASALLIYFPTGKLKHALYFFAARYHIGVFYGVRGVWPPGPK